MKINIKPIKINVGETYTDNSEVFNKLVETILECEFIASDCSHHDIDSFFSYAQGGRNTHTIDSITLLNETSTGNNKYKYSFKVQWRQSSDIGILIVKGE